MTTPKTYPDLSHIFAAKAQRRVALAALSWEEKVAIVEQMRALLPKGMWKERRGEAGGAKTLEVEEADTPEVSVK